MLGKKAITIRLPGKPNTSQVKAPIVQAPVIAAPVVIPVEVACCPLCGSDNVRWNTQKGMFTCKECSHKFKRDHAAQPRIESITEPVNATFERTNNTTSPVAPTPSQKRSRTKGATPVVVEETPTGEVIPETPEESIPHISKSERQEILHRETVGDRLRQQEQQVVAKQRPVSKLARVLEQQGAVAPKDSSNPPHMIIRARAGTGKTTTLVGGLSALRGLKTSMIPSPQQAAIWECMGLSAGSANRIAMVAFNAAIARELESRVPEGVDTMTNHKLGLSIIRSAGIKLRGGRDGISGYRVENLIGEVTGKDVREMKKYDITLLNATKEMVGLCKQNLIEWRNNDNLFDELADLAKHYDVELSEGSRSYATEVFSLVPQILERCLDVEKDRQIDFNDMIWLPIVLNLPIPVVYDVLLVDEAQDLNRAQQELVTRCGRRLVLCGDDKQAIYGFAGADDKGLPRMEERLKATPAGCVAFPLTVTRRCGKAIVQQAQRYVPDFEAFESNPEGVVKSAKYPVQEGPGGSRTEIPFEQNYMSMVQDGDFILCRVNAPLVSQCFRFLRMGRKASIQGRNIGEQLEGTIKQMKATSIDDLVAKVTDWLAKETTKEQAKRNPSESKLIAMQDRADCILCFTEGAQTIDDVLAKIKAIFTDDENVKGIRLSTVHKAKGLEAHRVFILQPKGATMPHPMARSQWQVGQEYNLLYVAITRAIHELVYVS